MMDPVFTINFRREALRHKHARRRRRVIALGVWVAYFGALAVIMGLYGLNAVALQRRVAHLERQNDWLRQRRTADWVVQANEITQLEHYVENAGRWRDRLVRLTTTLPGTVRITSLAVNPQNLTAAAEQNKLVLCGILKPEHGEDRIQGVMRVVSALHSDSVFAAGYQNVKLASTRAAEGSDASAEFVIECR